MEVAILDAVRAMREEWVRLVTDLAEMESPSTDRGAQGPIHDRLAAEFESLGFRIRRHSDGILLAVGPHGEDGQLLLGHSDTVWDHGTLRTMPIQLEGGILHGPGVFDMKAGLAQMVFALRALRSLDLHPSLRPVVLVNSDEETGSHDSTRHIVRVARRVRRAFVLEPALGSQGLVKTARKGTGRFTVRVTGRESHAGLAPEEGISAIDEMARIILALHDLPGVNVGVVRGGTRANVVAGEAIAEVDLRIIDLDQGREVESRILGLTGERVQVTGGIDRPPLDPEGNRELWGALERIAERMGIPLEEGFAGGASDGNTTGLHTPTLDGLGAVGGGAHARHEQVDVNRTLERCALLASLIMLP